MLVYLRYFVVALSYADYIIPCFRGWLTSPLEWLYFAVQVALGERFLQHFDFLSKKEKKQPKDSAYANKHKSLGCMKINCVNYKITFIGTAVRFHSNAFFNIDICNRTICVPFQNALCTICVTNTQCNII